MSFDTQNEHNAFNLLKTFVVSKLQSVPTDDRKVNDDIRVWIEHEKETSSKTCSVTCLNNVVHSRLIIRDTNMQLVNVSVDNRLKILNYHSFFALVKNDKARKSHVGISFEYSFKKVRDTSKKRQDTTPNTRVLRPRK